MQTSEQIDQIATAMSLFQAAVPPIPRNRKVKVKSKKTGAEYEFTYATLDAICHAIAVPMSDHGLAFTQLPQKTDKGLMLITRVMHSSGQWIGCELPVVASQSDGAQALGSALTYMRRYSLSLILGIAADEDDDGNGADGNELLRREDPKPPARQQPPAGVNTDRQVEPTPQEDTRTPLEKWCAYLKSREDAAALMAALDQCLKRDSVAGDPKLYAKVILAFGDEIRERMDNGGLTGEAFDTLAQYAQAKSAQQPNPKTEEQS